MSIANKGTLINSILLIIILLNRLSSILRSMKKNTSAFASTGDPDLFKTNTSSARLLKNEKNFPYANVPMSKDLPQWNTSSSVLRNSTTLYTIPKDSRFKQPKINYYNHLQLKYPSSLSNRGTNFGYGKKADVPEVFRNNANVEGINAPFYEIDDAFLRRSKSATIKKGKTIGVNWNSYATARAPHRSTVHCSQQTRSNPGLKYEISREAGQTAQKNKMHERLMMFTDLRGHQTLNQPGPQNYLINERHVTKASMKTNFGVGKKSDFTCNP